LKIADKDSSLYLSRPPLGGAKPGLLRCGSTGRRSRGQSLRQLYLINDLEVHDAISIETISVELVVNESVNPTVVS